MIPLMACIGIYPHINLDSPGFYLNKNYIISPITSAKLYPKTI